MDMQDALLNIKTELKDNEEIDDKLSRWEANGDLKLELTFKVEVDTGVPEEIPHEEPDQRDVGSSFSRDIVNNHANEATRDGPLSESSGNFLCKFCTYECIGKDVMEKHVRIKHGHIGRAGKYKCQWCDYSTDSVGNRKRHQLTHTGDREFMCGQCHQTFSRRAHLKQHVQGVHQGLRPHRCDVCSKSFAKKSDLIKHRRSHTGVSVVQCEKCDKKFIDRSNYVKHMKVHEGVKPYHCGECSARFTEKQNLTTHLRMHTGERPYTCAYCQDTFSHKTGMTSHVIAKHTHDFKHRCMYCRKGFIRPNRLRQHMGKCAAKMTASSADTAAK